MMRGRLRLIWQIARDTNGSEIVEWIVWVGGMIVLATALYASVSTVLVTRLAGLFG